MAGRACRAQRARLVHCTAPAASGDGTPRRADTANTLALRSASPLVVSLL